MFREDAPDTVSELYFVAAWLRSFPQSRPRFRKKCVEAISRTRFGRCNRRELRAELPRLLKACFVPLTSSGLADR